MAGGCALSLMMALLALCFAFANGEAIRWFALDHAADITNVYRLSQARDFPLPMSLQIHNLFFPDTAVLLLLSHWFDNPYLAVYGFAILCLMTMAVSCLFLTRRLWQNDTLTWLALPMIGLMALLMIIGDGKELFATAIAAHFRTGLLALQPLLLLLVVNTLFTAGYRRSSIISAIALFSILFFLHVSFKLILLWFVIPAVAAAALTAWRRWLSIKLFLNWRFFVIALVSAYLSAKIFRAPLIELFVATAESNDQASSLSFSLSQMMLSLNLFFKWLYVIITRSPLLAFLWLAFLALLIQVFWRGIRKPFKFDHSGKDVDDARFYVVTFMLFAIILPVVAAICFGKFGIWGRIEHFANHRYFSPSVYWPLFWGWPVLLGFFRFSFLTRWMPSYFLSNWRGEAVVMVFAGILICLSLPWFRYAPDIGALAEYNPPFLQCVQKNAEKFKLKYGIANADFASYLSAHGKTTAGNMNAIGVLNFKALANYRQRPLGEYQYPFKLYDSRTLSGTVQEDYNYIVINQTDEAKRLTAPENTRCSGRLQNPERCFDEPPYVWMEYHFIDNDTAVGYYGEPDNRFRCLGVDFYVYDKPLDVSPLGTNVY